MYPLQERCQGRFVGDGASELTWLDLCKPPRGLKKICFADVIEVGDIKTGMRDLQPAQEMFAMSDFGICRKR